VGGGSGRTCSFCWASAAWIVLWTGGRAVNSNFEPKYRYTGAALTSDLAWLIGAAFCAGWSRLGLSAHFGLAYVSVYLLSGAGCTLAALSINRTLEIRDWMAKRNDVPGIKSYDKPAGGWGALRSTARAVRKQMDVHVAPMLLLRTNKPDGFDCPGCAWPDKDHTSTFQFCENGAKAVTWEPPASGSRLISLGPYRHVPVGLDGLRAGERRQADAPIAYDRARHVPAHQLGRCFRADPHRVACLAGSQHG